MMCLRNFLLFLIVLPFPAASPIFMLAFITAMWFKLKPCFYCTIVLSIYFYALSSSSYISLSFPDDPVRSVSMRPGYNTTFQEQPSLRQAEETLSGFKYAAPISSRSWIDLNHGRWLWPKLEGYRLLDEKPANQADRADTAIPVAVAALDTASKTVAPDPAQVDIIPSAPLVSQTGYKPQRSANSWYGAIKSSIKSRHGPHQQETAVSVKPKPDNAHASDPTPPASPEVHAAKIIRPKLDGPAQGLVRGSDFPLQKKPWFRTRYDLRYQGIGFVLDLGWGRSEETVRQEVKEWLAWEHRDRQQLVQPEQGFSRFEIDAETGPCLQNPSKQLLDDARNNNHLHNEL